MGSLIMCLTGAAYVIVKTVLAGIDFSDGFYFKYADWSDFANQMWLYEIIVILLWQIWSLEVTIVALVSAGYIWSTLDARLAEAAAGSIGVETPLTLDKAIKAFTLCMLTGLTVVIAAYALGESADELVAFFDDYDDKTDDEGTDKDTGKKDAPGASALADIGYHLATAVYGHFVLSAIAAGGFLFTWIFFSFDDSFECDLQEGVISAATYAAAGGILAAQTDRASCLETIQKVFDIEDINGDGFITRCEDATLQRAFGATREYAFKFSSSFDRAAFNKICHENFKA